MTRTISDSERLVIAKLNRTETELKQAKEVDIIERREENKNRIQIPKPKQSLLDRFISLFR